VLTPVVPLPPVSSVCLPWRPAKCIDQRCEAPIGRHADCRNRPGAPQLTVQAHGSHARRWRCARGPGAAVGEPRSRACSRSLMRLLRLPPG
jgi:hypothetical protein